MVDGCENPAMFLSFKRISAKEFKAKKDTIQKNPLLHKNFHKFLSLDKLACATLNSYFTCHTKLTKGFVTFGIKFVLLF